jgi:hypothetical protein
MQATPRAASGRGIFSAAVKSTDRHQQDAGASAVPLERAASMAQAFDAPHSGHSAASIEARIVDVSSRR